MAKSKSYNLSSTHDADDRSVAAITITDSDKRTEVNGKLETTVREPGSEDGDEEAPDKEHPMVGMVEVVSVKTNTHRPLYIVFLILLQSILQIE